MILRVSLGPLGSLSSICCASSCGSRLWGLVAPRWSSALYNSCIAAIRDIILNITLQRWRGLAQVGRRRRGGAHPHSQIGPQHCTIAALVVQTLCHHPCCPCPALVPHLSPPQTPSSLPVMLSISLCLVEVVFAILVNVLLLLALAIG